MTLVALLEGPECAGKTTLARRLASPLSRLCPTDLTGRELQQFPCSEAEFFGSTIYRHWRGHIPTVWSYLEAAKYDAKSPYPVVWDRAWPSEWVYSNLLDREDKGIKNDPWLGEWCFGRAFQVAGFRVAVLGPSAEELSRRRGLRVDSDDLPVSPVAERSMYREYALGHGYTITEDAASIERTIDKICSKYERWLDTPVFAAPPRWAGPFDAPIVVVGEARSLTDDRSWLPFTSAYTERLGRSLGETALLLGWTNVEDIADCSEMLDNRRLIVACGVAATSFAMKHTRNSSVYSIPHPAALYRWGEFRERIPEVERGLKQVVEALV